MTHDRAAGERARSRTLVIGVGSGAVSRALSILTPLLVIPVSLQYLGASAFGAWALGLSVTSMLMFADLGIGAGLMTKLGQTKPDDRDAARAYISNSYAVVTLVVAASLLVLFGTAPFISWPSVVGADDADSAHVEAILLVTLAGFLISMLSALIVRVQYGIGQQGRSNAWQVAGSLSTLGAAYGAAAIDPGKVEFIVAAAFAPVMAGLVNTAYFFALSPRGRRLRPDLALISRPGVRTLIGLGGKFLVITALLTITTQCDLWIVSRTDGIDSVTDYAIPYRVTSVVAAISLMLSLPLWPLHAQAVASGDTEWIRRITRKMVLINVGVLGALSLVTALAGPSLVDVWLGGAVDRQPILWSGLALWWFVQCITGPPFMVQNGAEVLAPQTVGYVCLLVSIPVKWWVAATFGPVWIPWVGAALFVAIIWPACAVGYGRSMRLVASKGSPSGVGAPVAPGDGGEGR